MSFKKVLVSILFLMVLSPVIHADTYPAIPTSTYVDQFGRYSFPTGQQVCDAYKTNFYPTQTVTYTTGKCNLSAGGYITVIIYPGAYICPGGGTVSGTNCINATACTSPETRSLTTGMCGCQPPKFTNSVGMCEIPECLSYQVPNACTGVCQIPVVCGSTEHVDSCTNACVLNTLNCPGHSHSNTTNDGCLPDPPNACPVGQHDNGSYVCVADDAIHCKVNQQSGYINGVKQCIGAPKLDTGQAEAAKNATAQAAIDASNADSTNSGLANQATNKSFSALMNSSYEANRKLESIANSANDSENRAKERQAVSGGKYCDQPPACSGDSIQCAALLQDFNNNCLSKDPLPTLSDKEVGGSVDKINGIFTAGIPADFGASSVNGQAYVNTSFWNLSNSSCQSIPMHYKALQYDFDPCTKLAPFRELLGWFFYVFTAFGIANLLQDLK